MLVLDSRKENVPLIRGEDVKYTGDVHRLYENTVLLYIYFIWASAGVLEPIPWRYCGDGMAVLGFKHNLVWWLSN